MNSINLLPKHRKSILGFERHASQAWFILLLVVLALLIVWGITRYERKQVEQETSDLLTENQKLSQAVARYDQISKEAGSLAKNVTEFTTIVKNDRDWADMFRYIEQSLPPNVHITAINTSQDQGKYLVAISGLAENRRAVGVFREALLYQSTDEDSRQRVSNVVVDSINALSQEANSGHNFALRATFDLSP